MHARSSSPTSAGPFGRNVAPTAAIRGAVRAAGFDAPIVVAGGIHNFEMAEDISRAAMRTSSARRASRSPIPTGSENSARPRRARCALCDFTNYCEGLDQKHKPVTCQLWDKLPSATANRRTPDGKRRLTAPAWHVPDRRS